MLRRICLYGAPSAGKSTVSHGLFSYVKNEIARGGLNIRCEFVQEHVKKWAYLGRTPQETDQVLLFASQLNDEELYLRTPNSVVITESPLYLSCMYGLKYNLFGTPEIFSMAQRFEEKHPALHIWLNRGNRKYVQEGRFQTESESDELANFFFEKLTNVLGTDTLHVVESDEHSVNKIFKLWLTLQ